MPTARSFDGIEILLVEDEEDYVELMFDALKDGGVNAPVIAVANGEEAMGYLRRQRENELLPPPDLILLDLHMPRMDGYEVLEEMTRDELLRRIPVVILTTSDKMTTIPQAADLHAYCCVAKPVNLEQFATAVEKIEQFWLQL